MVLYFTGTGNSRYVAREIARRIGDKLISINYLIKRGGREKLVSKTQPFTIICPTYAWRIPRVVDEFIRTAIFPGSNKAYFILTCGADTLNAINYVETLCRNKGWELQGFAEIVMPDNYIAVYPAPDKITARETIQKADSSIRQVAEYINDGSEFSIYTAGGFGGRIKSGIVNGLFYKLFVCAKGFYVTEKCTGCGKCSELCSLNNIKVSNIPKWGARCTCCMACIGGCPEAAIEYKNKTQGKKRYYFDLAE